MHPSPRIRAWTAPILGLLLLGGCRARVASLDAMPRRLSFYGTEQSKEVSVRALDSKGAPVAEMPPVTWTSSNPQIVEVSPSGHVVPRSPGKATVTAHSGPIASSVAIEVIDLSKIELAPALLRLVGPRGTIARLELTGKSSAGSTVPVPPATWILSNPKVATIGASGEVSSLAPGKTLATARLGDLVAGSEVEVDIRNVSRIELRPETAILHVGETQKLAVTAYDEQGSPIPEAGAQLSTSAPDVVRVQGDGTITGLKSGTAFVTATIGDRKAMATVLVQ